MTQCATCDELGLNVIAQRTTEGLAEAEDMWNLHIGTMHPNDEWPGAAALDARRDLPGQPFPGPA